MRPRVQNTLFDEEGPRKFSDSFTRRDEIFLQRILLEFDEIVNSYLSLRDIEIYIRRFPYHGTGVSSLRYLRYHIESYLNEVYIFKERIEAHTNFLENRYRKSAIGQDIREMGEYLKALISNTLSTIITTRGSHVHECRYSDQDLDRLFLLEMMARSNNEDEVFLEEYKLNYKKIRKKWSKIITTNNDVIERLFDTCCIKLHSILFTKDGQIVFPDDR